MALFRKGIAVAGVKRAIDRMAAIGKGAIKTLRERGACGEAELARRKAKDGVVYVFDGGKGALLEVYADRVIICRRKRWLGETIEEKTIDTKDLTSVELKEAQRLYLGYLRFTVLDGNDTNKTGDAAWDPYAIAIAQGSKNAAAAEIKHYIEKRMQSIKSAADQRPPLTVAEKREIQK